MRTDDILLERPAAAQTAPSGDDFDAFRQAVREFLARELTEDLRRAGRETTGVHSEISAAELWHKRLYRRGWIAPAWPVDQGGTGWTAKQRFYFDQECARNDAPVLFAAGLRSIGPLIIAVGTDEQKNIFLPKILSGEDLWCQGFSEAGAGSDLAAIATRADRQGDHYLVTGRKLWTTGAHLSNRMFALVRTDKGTRPQECITFLLIDMATPGITVNPIVTLDGEHEFNEVVFDGAAVPVGRRLGDENDGWSVAKHLMRFARTNNTNSALLRRTWRSLERALECDGTLESSLLERVHEVEIELLVFESLEVRLHATHRLSGDDEAGASLMKVAATELHQKITELLVAVDGPAAALGGTPTKKYLATRAASIYSGTSEVHRNVLARAMLGRL